MSGAITMKDLLEQSPARCPVCGIPVPGTRDTFCSPECFAHPASRLFFRDITELAEPEGQIETVPQETGHR